MKKLLAIFTLIAFFAVMSAYAAGPISFGGSGSGDMLKADNLSGLANYSTARNNMGVAIGSDVQAYSTNIASYATATPSANTLSLLSAASYAAMKALLDLEIGTDINAYSANIASYATATPSANTLSLLGAATYAAMRTLLDLEAGTDFNAYSDNIASYSTASPSANTLSLLGAANYAAMKVLLDLEIGTDVQAYSSILGTIAGTATSANKIYGVNSDGTIGLYGNIRQDNSAAQFVDAANATKLILIDPSGGTGTLTIKNEMTATGTVDIPSDFTDGDGVVGKLSSQTLTNKILTAPYIQGYEFVASQTTTLFATQAYGGRVNNYGQATNVTVTLPTANYGMDIVFCMGTATPATYAITGSMLYYSGGYSSSAKIQTPAVGDYFVVYSFKTGASTWSWILKNGQGTIATF